MSQQSMIIRLVNEHESIETLDRQTRALVNDFRLLEGVTAAMPEGTAPIGSLGDPVTVGTIAVAFVTGGGITAIIQALSEWLRRGENRKVVLKVSINDNTFEAEFPSSGITQKEIIELTEKIKTLLAASTKRKG